MLNFPASHFFGVTHCERYISEKALDEQTRCSKTTSPAELSNLGLFFVRKGHTLFVHSNGTLTVKQREARAFAFTGRLLTHSAESFAGNYYVFSVALIAKRISSSSAAKNRGEQAAMNSCKQFIWSCLSVPRDYKIMLYRFPLLSLLHFSRCSAFFSPHGEL